MNPDNPPTASADRPTNVRWMIFGLSCSTSFLLYLHRYTWGMMKRDLAEEFDWSLAELSVLDSCFNLSYAMGQVPLGMVGDWFGPRIALGSTIALWSVSMGATVLATGFVSMYIVRFLFGLAQAGCYSNLSKVTKLWFPPRVRTTVQGWVASFSGRNGGAMSNVIFATLLMGFLALTWEKAILVLMAVGLVFAVVFTWLFRNRPIEHPWANAAEAKLTIQDDPDAAVATRSRLKWSRVVKSGNMWVFLFQQFTSAFADNLYPYWIPLFLLVEKGVNVETAGILAALPLFGGGFGGMTAGTLQTWLIVRTGNRRWVRSLTGCTGKLLAAIVMFISLSFDQAIVITSLFAVVKFFGDWSQPTVWGTCTDIGGRNSASVFGTVNMMGSIAGFVASPVMGLLILEFSETQSVTRETISITSDNIADESEQATTIYPLANKAVVDGSPRGTITADGQEIGDFQINDEGELQFDLVDNPSSTPRVEKSRVRLNKGEVVIGWDEAPEKSTLTIDYEYHLYGNGWTALFIALGLIYLASALSWLFIDCTKTLDDPVGTA